MVTWYEFSLLVLFLHFLADFPLQGEFLAKWKGKDWYVLFVHSFIYSFIVFLPFYLLLDYPAICLVVIVVCHMSVDRQKCKAIEKLNINKDLKQIRCWLYVDQISHLLVLFIPIVFNIISGW